MSLLDLLPQARWDVGLFSREFLGIELHPGQVELSDAYLLRQPDGWRPAYLTIADSAGNRAGKTLGLSEVIFHSCLFKMNQPLPDLLSESSIRTWMRQPYDWYHFGIQQEVAELVYVELVRILEGRHEAQKGHGCPMVDELGPIAKFDKKFRGEYPWIVIDPMLGGAEIHFRTTTEKAIGSLGKSMHGVSMDEAGFEQNLEFIVNEVFQLRRLSTGGQLFMISTPSEGFTAFADQWEKGNPENPARLPRHHSLYMSTRDNIGYGIDQDLFDALVAAMPPELIPQNIDGRFIQGAKSFFNAKAVDACFDSTYPARQPAVAGRNYIIGIDPAITHDNTFGICLDVTDRNRVVGVAIDRLRGKQTTESVLKLAHDLHAEYAQNGMRAVTGVDVTGFGGKQFRDQLGNLPGLRGVEFGGSAMTKLRLLMDLKSSIEGGRMRFPRDGHWLELRRELLAYRLPDRKLETDAVMALAIAVKLMLRTPAGASSASMPFRYLTEEPQRRGEESQYWKDLRRRGTFQRLGDLV